MKQNQRQAGGKNNRPAQSEQARKTTGKASSNRSTDAEIKRLAHRAVVIARRLGIDPSEVIDRAVNGTLWMLAKNNIAGLHSARAIEGPQAPLPEFVVDRALFRYVVDFNPNELRSIAAVWRRWAEQSERLATMKSNEAPAGTRN